MTRFVKDVYLTAFTICFRAGGAAWPPNVNAGKGVAGVALIESALLLGISARINMQVAINTPLDIPKWAAVVFFLALCAANYYPLVIRGHGTAFEREFGNLEKSKRILLRVSCLAVIVGAVAFFVHSGMAHRRFINGD